jgi:hypothetical protein
MRRRACIFGMLVVVACVMRPELGACAQDTAMKVDIGNSEIGAPPAGFELSPLEGQQGSWTVVRDATAKTGMAIQKAGLQTAEDRFSLAIYKPASLKNAEIRLRLNAAGGKLDQGGGIAMRLSDPQNYSLVHLDALTDLVLLSLVSNGISKEIVAVDADIASHAWHDLTVWAKDDQFIVSLDGVWVVTGFDRTLSHAGRIALWTKGDSITRFDSIAITPLSASEERY